MSSEDNLSSGMPAADETPKQVESKPNKVEGKWQRWNQELKVAGRPFKRWDSRCTLIRKKFRAETAELGGGERHTEQYNIFWSTINTLSPNLYLEPPVPYVHRKDGDADPVARDGGMMLERILKWHMQTDDDVDDSLRYAVQDYMLYARGQTWVRYKPEFALRFSADKVYFDDEREVPEGAKQGRDTDGATYYRQKYKKKVSETLVFEHVERGDFRHGVASKWKYVPWVSRRVPMNLEELQERFGEELAAKIPLAMKEKAEDTPRKDDKDDFKSMFARAEIWEIWDRVRRKVYWMCPDFSEQMLDEEDDPLGLRSFFPCPEPMYGTRTPDSLVPVPDLVYIQDILLDIDEITNRISLLMSALRVVGVYSEEYGEQLKQLLKNTGENDLIPVKNWSMFAEKGGLAGAVDFLDLNPIIEALKQLYEAHSVLMQRLYEITGISDIIRGDSNPHETAAAQKIKGNFATKRLKEKQRVIGRHVRALMDIAAEIICQFYNDETIIDVSNAQAFCTLPESQQNPNSTTFDQNRCDDAIALLRDGHHRKFRVMIDTEDLSGDAIQADQSQREQFLQGMSTLLTAAIPGMAQVPNIAPVLGELIKFGVRGFPLARSMEHSIETAIDKFVAEGPKPPTDTPSQQPQGDAGSNQVDLQIAQTENQTKMLELQLKKMDLDSKHQIASGKLQVDTHKAQVDGQVKMGKLQLDTHKASAEHQLAVQQVGIEQQAAHTDMQVKQHGMQLDTASHQLDQQAQATAAAGQQHQQHMDQQNFAAGRQDAQHSQGMAEAGHQQQVDNDNRQAEHEQRSFKAEQQNITADRKMTAKNAAADRTLKAKTATKTAAKPAAKPKR